MAGLLQRLVEGMRNLASGRRTVDMPATPLREYLFADLSRLKSYVEQISGPQRVVRTPSWEVGLSSGGVSAGAKQTQGYRDYTTQEMIEIVSDYLTNSRLVANCRPSHARDVGSEFVLETLTARKAIFTLPTTAAVLGLENVAVWVSPPTGSEFDHNNGRTGTYLYLIEAYWKSDAGCGFGWSGYSAFHWLLRELEEASVISSTSSTLLETNYEFRRLPPMARLEFLGAAVQPPRRIEVLYRKRFITDDQYHFEHGRDVMTNDLFAYPIFIRG